MVQMFMRDVSVRFRVSALERFCYKGFLRNLSGTKTFVSLREVSALEDIHLREVPLYYHQPKTDNDRQQKFLFNRLLYY